MRRLAFLAFACLLTAGAAHGARCGDDVDGHGTAVPCACGDTLVASRTLSAADAITQTPCPGTGLVVRVPVQHPGAVLRLSGHTITGSGVGTGIEVSSGGRRGLTLEGPGDVRGFALGVDAGGGALVAASDVGAFDNRTDGFSVAGVGWTLRGCDASSNGRDGFSLRGARFRVDGNRAYGNHRYGFRIAGVEAAVVGNEAAANGRDGVVVTGRDVDVTDTSANANHGSGVSARLVRGRMRGAQAAGNGKDGVRASGIDLGVAETRAEANGGTDVRQRGACRGKACR
jgi:hypothetical protein